MKNPLKYKWNTHRAVKTIFDIETKPSKYGLLKLRWHCSSLFFFRLCIAYANGYNNMEVMTNGVLYPEFIDQIDDVMWIVARHTGLKIRGASPLLTYEKKMQKAKARLMKKIAERTQKDEQAG